MIISGLALGIDSIAHQATLQADGRTIAVLPAGLDRIYPASHQQLAERILQQHGALVTEYSGVDRPMKHQFIARNRLIAGLADAVLITEAAAKSGSLHTADFALQLGIDVLAVPGNITSPGSAGVNGLIKNGAIPITSTRDLLDYFGVSNTRAQPTFTSAVQAAIYRLLQKEELTSEQLIVKSGLTIQECSQALTLLEVEGHIALDGSGLWSSRDIGD